MTARLTTPLRWTEEAEAEAMCAEAVLEREPQSAAVRVAADAAAIASAAPRRRRPSPLYPLAWLHYQITRDGEPRNGLLWLAAKLSRQAWQPRPALNNRRGGSGETSHLRDNHLPRVAAALRGLS